MRAKLFIAAVLAALSMQAQAGEWQSVPFDAANFSASNNGKWIVPENGVTGYSYKIIDDDTMILQWSIENASVEGAPLELYLAIPAGKWAVTEQSTTFSYYNNFRAKRPTPLEIGIACTTLKRQNYVQLRRAGLVKWSNAQGGPGRQGTYVFGQIVLRLETESPANPSPSQSTNQRKRRDGEAGLGHKVNGGGSGKADPRNRRRCSLVS